MCKFKQILVKNLYAIYNMCVRPPYFIGSYECFVIRTMHSRK